LEIHEVTRVSSELVSAFEHLIPQLSSSSHPPTRADLEEIVSSPSYVLFAASDPSRGGEIIGSLTLVIFRTPTGKRASIEDIIVDSGARRRGIGEALSRKAIEYAADAGAKSVNLTSRPSREAANRLYLKIGFKKRETNVYQYRLDLQPD